MKPIDDTQYLAAKHDEFACYKLPVNEETYDFATYLRGLHKNRLHRARYEGYCENVDRDYHLNGVYFYVLKNGEIATVVRLNERTSDLVFPFEMGRLENGTQYNYAGDKPAIDLNTYYPNTDFPNSELFGRATPLLFAAAANYLKEEGVSRAFGLYDIENEKIKDLYSSLGFKDSKCFSEPVLFDTFLNKFSKQAVRWAIVEWNKEAIELNCDRFCNQYEVSN